MAATGKVDYLVQEVERAIGDADRRRHKHKWFSVVIRLGASGCTAAIPVVLGWRVSPDRAVLLGHVAMVLGALATVLIAYETFYGHRELWAINTAAATQLHALELDLGYLKAGNPDIAADEALDELRTRLKEILNEADSAWVGVRQSTAKQPPPRPSSGSDKRAV